MKQMIVLLGCMMGFWSLQAQYHVLHVDGKVLNERQKMFLVEGMILPEEASISLQSENARICVWHPVKGRMISREEKPSDTYYPLKELLKEGSAAKNYPIKPRLEDKGDVIEYFKRGNFLLLGKTEIVVSNKSFPMGKGNHFFVTYNWSQMDALGNSRLGFHGDTLEVDPVKILNMNGREVLAKDLSDFGILYFNGSKQSKTLCMFKLVIPDDTKLRAEVKALMGLIDQQVDSKLDKREEALGYLSDVYGIPDRKSFDAWFDANILNP